jgi:hypothetical protein
LINDSVLDPFGTRREAGHPQPQNGIAMISRVLNLGSQSTTMTLLVDTIWVGSEGKLLGSGEEVEVNGWCKT